MPRNLSPAVLAAAASPTKQVGLFLELNFENAITTVAPLPTYTITGVQVVSGVLYVTLSVLLTQAQQNVVVAGPVAFEGLTGAAWLNNVILQAPSVGINDYGATTVVSFSALPTGSPLGLAGMPLNYAFTADTGSIVVGGSAPNTGPLGSTYGMLDWMLMSPALAAANYFKSTELDGVTPANHLYTQLNAGNFYWIKGDSGYPWDINIFDNEYIYLSTTENSAGTDGGYGDPHQGKRFESLNPAIGLKGVPFAKRQMAIGDQVLSTDSRLAIYTACGVATYTNIGTVRCTLVGPFVETIPGAGSNLPANLTTIHIQYEWSLDGNYNRQQGTTMETYTFCKPYGLVHWQTQPWNVSTGAYDPPTNATSNNILTPGASGIPADDPCGFGTNGGGTLDPLPAEGETEGETSAESGSTVSLMLWSGVGNMSSLGPAWDPAATFPYGQVFIGMGWLARIESVPQNSELTAENMTLSLSGIPVALLGDVVNTVRLSGTAALWLAFFENGSILPDPVQLWDGALDVPTVSDGAETCTVSITVENALLALNLSSNRRFTTLDQQLDYPGDTGFDYVSAMQDLYLAFPDPTINESGEIGGPSGGPPSASSLSIAPVGPQKMILGSSPPLQMTATGIFITGQFSIAGGGPGSENVTSVGLWTSSNPMVATVSSGINADLNSGGGNFGSGGGLVTAQGLGNCTITFYFGQVSCSLTVTVIP